MSERICADCGEPIDEAAQYLQRHNTPDGGQTTFHHRDWASCLKAKDKRISALEKRLKEASP